MLGSNCSVAYRLVGRFGGMKIYETMRRRQPRFFIESGDSVYADDPIKAEVIAESGQIWTNRVTPEVGKVAESLAEFRGRYKYNLPDENIRRFNAEVPLLAARATQTFREYAPLRPHDAEESERIYRKIAYDPLLDVFVLDMRSYRGPNTANLQAAESRETAFLGEAQLAWLQRELQASAATWKVISADMPIGLNIGDGTDAQGNARWEALSNGDDGPAAGRELEIARLLRFIKHKHIDNIVWLTADVHCSAAHYYDPKQAAGADFPPLFGNSFPAR